MTKLFEITFLDEAFQFVKSLDKKHAEKIFKIFVNHRLKLTPKYSRNYEMIFGSLELCIKVCSIGYWHFGIKRIIITH